MTGTNEDPVQVSINSLRSYGNTLQPPLSAEWNKRAGSLIANLSELQRTLDPDATEGVLQINKTSCEHLSKWDHLRMNGNEQSQTALESVYKVLVAKNESVKEARSNQRRGADMGSGDVNRLTHQPTGTTSGMSGGSIVKDGQIEARQIMDWAKNLW